MEDLTNFVIDLDVKDLIQQVAMYVLITRSFFKPFFSFWNKKIAPFIIVKPTEKLLSNPIYKAVVYVLDWTSSIKLPMEKK